MADFRQEFFYVKVIVFFIFIVLVYYKIRYIDDEMLKLIIILIYDQNGLFRNSIFLYMYYFFLCVSNKVKINNDMLIYVKFYRDLII